MENHWQIGAALVGRIPAYTKLAYHLYRDPRVPARAKLRLSAALAYNLSPVDLVPGFIPLVGQLDDLIVMLYGIRGALATMPPGLAARHLSGVGLNGEEVQDDLAKAKILFGEMARGLAKKTVAAGKRLRGRLGRPKKKGGRAE